MEVPDRFVELLLEKPEEPPKEAKKPDADPNAGEGAKAKREEGKVGKKDAKMVRFLERRGFRLVSLEYGFCDPETAEMLQVDGIFAR